MPDEEDHRGAVHGEELIEDLRRHEVIVGDRKLDAHQQASTPPMTRKMQRVADVHQTDLLVVDGGDPLVDNVEWRPAGRCGQRLAQPVHVRSSEHGVCHGFSLTRAEPISCRVHR